jgi:hypothetical protein
MNHTRANDEYWLVYCIVFFVYLYVSTDISKVTAHERIQHLDTRCIASEIFFGVKPSYQKILLLFIITPTLFYLKNYTQETA